MSGHLPEVALLEVALDQTDALHPEVRAHLADCASCQRRVRDLVEDLATLTTRETATPPPALRTRLLSAIDPDAEAPLTGFSPRLARMFDLDEAQAQALLAKASGETAWELRGPFAYFHFTPGEKLASRAEAGIVRLEPGVTFPRHRHLGDEYALVLAGILREDDSGQPALPGDLQHMPEGSSHTVSCMSKTPCLFAVLLNGGTPIILDGN